MPDTCHTSRCPQNRWEFIQACPHLQLGFKPRDPHHLIWDWTHCMKAGRLQPGTYAMAGGATEQAIHEHSPGAPSRAPGAPCITSPSHTHLAWPLPGASPSTLPGTEARVLRQTAVEPCANGTHWPSRHQASGDIFEDCFPPPAQPSPGAPGCSWCIRPTGGLLPPRPTPTPVPAG